MVICVLQKVNTQKRKVGIVYERENEKTSGRNEKANDRC